jgi:hypothetical protein
MNNIYNEKETKQSKLIKDLKELPKIKAPDNFEFNLMARIENKNFGEQKEERLQFNLLKFLAPSAVVVVTIILFFIFLPSSNQNNNPLQAPNSQMIVDNSSSVTKEMTNKKLASPIRNDINNSSAVTNNQASKQMPSPINNPRAIRVDDYIANENANQRDLEHGNVVNSGDGSSQYDGFLIPEKTDKKTLEKYRARIDSIKKAQFRADSLKKMP